MTPDPTPLMQRPPFIGPNGEVDEMHPLFDGLQCARWFDANDHERDHDEDGTPRRRSQQGHNLTDE